MSMESYVDYLLDDPMLENPKLVFDILLFINTTYPKTESIFQQFCFIDNKLIERTLRYLNKENWAQKNQSLDFFSGNWSLTDTGIIQLYELEKIFYENDINKRISLYNNKEIVISNDMLTPIGLPQDSVIKCTLLIESIINKNFDKAKWASNYQNLSFSVPAESIGVDGVSLGYIPSLYIAICVALELGDVKLNDQGYHLVSLILIGYCKCYQPIFPLTEKIYNTTNAIIENSNVCNKEIYLRLFETMRSIIVFGKEEDSFSIPALKF